MSTEQNETGEEIVDGRVSVYGGITDTYPRIAQMISGLLGHEVQAWQVPLILVCLKLVRTTEAPNYSDNSDDIDGYMHIFREIIGEDMVHARTVDDYLSKLHEGETREENLLATIGELEAEVDKWKQRAQSAATIARQANP